MTYGYGNTICIVSYVFKNENVFFWEQRLFEDMKNRIEKVTNIGRVPNKLRLEHQGFLEWDSFTSPRDHAAIVQVIIIIIKR